MSRYLTAYGATFLAMAVLDIAWLGLVAGPLFQKHIGHLMAAQPLLPAAILFYLVYPVGLTLFAVLPRGPVPDLATTMRLAALFGFFAYATYDLTNLATLRDWPVGLACLDMAWGTLVSAACGAAGRLAVDRFAPG
jgi:uncharacterized membrane protein